MKRSRLLPMKLQLFAEGGTGGGESGSEGQAGSNQNTQQNARQQTETPAFDYKKLAGIISGKQTEAEGTILKNYFKQQGLSKEEADQAIAAFKAEKAKNTPDINALQTQLTETKKATEQAMIEKEAMIAALGLGLDIKTAPYVIKLADLSNVMVQDGKIDTENVKKALNKVLEDVPQLKTNTQATGGFRIGGQGESQNGTTNEEQLNAVFGV